MTVTVVNLMISGKGSQGKPLEWMPEDFTFYIQRLFLIFLSLSVEGNLLLS